MFDVIRVYNFLEKLGDTLRRDFGRHSVVAHEIASVTYQVEVRLISERTKQKWESSLRSREPAPKVIMRFEHIEHTFKPNVQIFVPKDKPSEHWADMGLDTETMDAVAEGVNNRGRRVPWEDDSYPW